MSRTRPSHFGQNAAKEVPLPRAPLALVIAQVRFPEIASIARPEFVGPYQEELRRKYPNAVTETAIELTADQPSRTIQLPHVSMWRFVDADDKWRVSLTSGFLALETTAYVSREDFLARWQDVLSPFERLVRTDYFTRLGVRYINRVERVEDLADIHKLVDPSMLPLTSLSAGFRGAKQTQVFAQSDFEVESANLRVRSALLPRMHCIDAASLPPIDRPSWVLDLDMFQVHTPPAAFSIKTVADQSEAFAESIYDMFRVCVTDEFVRRMGGQA